VVQFGKYCQIGDTVNSEHTDVELSHNFLMPFTHAAKAVCRMADCYCNWL